MYYVYIIRCEGNFLYTGITTDVERRFNEHSEGKVKGAKYTASHKPLGVEAVWEADNKSDAAKLEYRIKQLTKIEKEELIVTGATELKLIVEENEILFKKVL